MKKIKLALFILPLIMFTLNACEEAQIGKPANGGNTNGSNTGGDNNTDGSDTDDNNTDGEDNGGNDTGNNTGGTNDPMSNPAPIDNPFMNYKLDGTSNNVSGDLAISGTYDKEDKILMLTCVDIFNTMSTFNIVISDYAGTKTYPVAGQKALVSFIENITNAYSGISGSVTITSFANGVVKGTFEVTVQSQANEKKVLSGGSFAVNVK